MYSYINMKSKQSKQSKQSKHVSRRITKKKTVNGTRKTTTFKKDKCGPSSKKAFTCYSDKALIRLKKYWNIRHPDNIIYSNNNQYIWNELYNNISNTCNTESCWLKQQFIKHNLSPELSKYTFAPRKPRSWISNPNKWLDNSDITKVMLQYEYKYPCFDFIGPSPIDYNFITLNGKCVWDELCKFDVSKQIKKGKHRIGVIFNLDKHNLGGSHWVSLFIDLHDNIIYYFDSAGMSIPKGIMKFVNRIIRQSKNINKQIVFKQNKIIHQHSDTECGMYSLFFIIEMLQNDNNTKMFEKRIPDKVLIQLRNVYFNNY